MTARPATSASHPGLAVGTPDGPAQLTVVSVDQAVQLRPPRCHGPHRAPEIRGDRVVVRSRVDGRADVFGVFERPHQDGIPQRWLLRTGGLTAAELADWPTYRDHSYRLGARTERWLTQIIAHHTETLHTERTP